MNIDAHITRHALQRYQLHHPDAYWCEVRESMNQGLLVNTERVRQILERPYVSDGDVYILSPDRQGVFILRDGGAAVVTYLRMTPAHQRACRERWPVRTAAI